MACRLDKYDTIVFMNRITSNETLVESDEALVRLCEVFDETTYKPFDPSIVYLDAIDASASIADNLVELATVAFRVGGTVARRRMEPRVQQTATLQHLAMCWHKKLLIAYDSTLPETILWVSGKQSDSLLASLSTLELDSSGSVSQPTLGASATRVETSCPRRSDQMFSFLTQLAKVIPLMAVDLRCTDEP